jgi:hypothetical protein
VPVSFLTSDQIKSYGRYDGVPSPEELTRYFHLDDHDRASIGRRREKYNRLGFSLSSWQRLDFSAPSSTTLSMCHPSSSPRWHGSCVMKHRMTWQQDTGMDGSGWSMSPKFKAAWDIVRSSCINLISAIYKDILRSESTGKELKWLNLQDGSLRQVSYWLHFPHKRANSRSPLLPA